ncbi:MAG: PAN domain-containing protein [Nitrospiraceae bacterium]
MMIRVQMPGEAVWGICPHDSADLSRTVTMRSLWGTILLGFLLSLPSAALATADGTGTLLTTVRLERPLHFPTPSGDPILLPPGEYVVESQESQALQLKATNRTAVVISATTGRHEEELEQPLALAVPDEAAPPLTHLLLLLPDGRTFQSTGSADGVMSRMISTHIVVAVLKAFVTGAPLKQTMNMETNTSRSGKAYRTSSLFAGMCALLCERDEDCRAFTWKRDRAKPVKGSCLLMENVASKQQDDCCISGVKSDGRTK